MINNQKFEEIYNSLSSTYSSYFNEINRKNKRNLLLLFLPVIIMIGTGLILGALSTIIESIGVLSENNAIVVGSKTIMIFFPFIMPFGFIAMIVIGIIFSVKNSSNAANQRLEYKRKIVFPFIQSLNPRIAYEPEKGMLRQAYNDGEFEGYDRYTSEDLLTGELGDHWKFQMADVHTEDEHTDSDGHTSYTTVFRGLYAFMPLQNAGNLELYLRSDVKDSSKFLSKIFKKRFDNLYTKLDSKEFENEFDVYTNDKIFAMQLLTADTMQNMVQYKKGFKVNYELTIKNGYLYLRFPTYRSVFEPAFFKKDAIDKITLYNDYCILDTAFSIMHVMYNNLLQVKK